MMLPRFLVSLLGPRRVVTGPTPVDVSRRGAPAGRIEEAGTEPYVLLLRTFGRDGSVRVGNSLEGQRYDVDTLESEIAGACERFGVRPVSFNDHRADHVPHGIEYYVSPHATWREHFVALARHARAVIVMTAGPAAHGDSFGFELDQLRRLRLAGRVIVVCPPGLERRCHGPKAEVFERLGWPVPPLMPLVACRASTGQVVLYPSLGEGDDSLAKRYGRGLDDAFTRVVAPLLRR